MKVIIEIDSKNEMEKLSAILKIFKVNKVNVIFSNGNNIPVNKGDKKIDPKGLFGIWANKPRSLENIRKDAWQRKTDTW